MFQYDNPSDSDDDDYAYFDDDFDEDGLDDFEIENTKKIFVTLQDSYVIKRLSFHKSCGSFRSVDCNIFTIIVIFFLNLKVTLCMSILK